MSRQGAIAVLLVIVLVATVWYFWPQAAPEVPEPAVTEATPAPPPVVSPAEPEPDPLPPLDASDGLAMEALRSAGGSGPLGAVFDQEELVRRFVGSVAAVAQGTSPTQQLGFLAPADQFRASREGDGWVVDPSSFARYDGLAAAIGNLDAAELTERYRLMEPLFDDAYAELGVEGSFRVVLLQAIDLLAATPVPSLPVELEDRVEYYAYADAVLEAQSDAQKHLMRLGPENQRVVIAKLRELRQTLSRLP